MLSSMPVMNQQVHLSTTNSFSPTSSTSSDCSSLDSFDILDLTLWQSKSQGQKSPKQGRCVKSPYNRQRQTRYKSGKIPARPGNQPGSSLVIPLPIELSQLEPNTGNTSEHNMADDAGNPFECLASFYFPEHLEYSKGEDIQEYQGDKSIWTDTHKTEEESSEDYEASTSNKKNELTPAHNQSEVMTSVPNLMRILQAKSQKKIFLEERK